MKSTDAVRALAALAQEKRLAIFRLLVQAGAEGLAAGRIAERLDLALPTLSFHLKELSQSGLVTSRSASRFVFYAANFERMAALMAYLTQNCCRGMPEQCLTTLETALAGCCSARPEPAERKSP